MMPLPVRQDSGRDPHILVNQPGNQAQKSQQEQRAEDAKQEDQQFWIHGVGGAEEGCVVTGNCRSPRTNYPSLLPVTFRSPGSTTRGRTIVTVG
jgi:hypothetical protein